MILKRLIGSPMFLCSLGEFRTLAAVAALSLFAKGLQPPEQGAIL